MWVGGDERWFHISPRRRKQCVSYEQGTAAQAAVPQPGLTQRIRSGPYKLVSDAKQVETAASLRRALEEASLGHTSRPQANGGKCGPPFQGTAPWPPRSTSASATGRPGGGLCTSPLCRCRLAKLPGTGHWHPRTHCTHVRAGCCCCCEPRSARPRRCCPLYPCCSQHTTRQHAVHCLQPGGHADSGRRRRSEAEGGCRAGRWLGRNKFGSSIATACGSAHGRLLGRRLLSSVPCVLSSPGAAGCWVLSLKAALLALSANSCGRRVRHQAHHQIRDGPR